MLTESLVDYKLLSVFDSPPFFEKQIEASKLIVYPDQTFNSYLLSDEIKIYLKYQKSQNGIFTFTMENLIPKLPLLESSCEISLDLISRNCRIQCFYSSEKNQITGKCALVVLMINSHTASVALIDPKTDKECDSSVRTVSLSDLIFKEQSPKTNLQNKESEQLAESALSLSASSIAEEKSFASLSEDVERTGHPAVNFVTRFLKQHPDLMDTATNEEKILERRQRFPETEQEIFIVSLSCALQQRILLQGRLYLTSESALFYSPFNESTIFGSDPTKITFKLSAIACVKKRTTLIFPNALEFILADGTTYFLASFVQREKAHSIVGIVRELNLELQKNGLIAFNTPSFKAKPSEQLNQILQSDDVELDYYSKPIEAAPLYHPIEGDIGMEMIELYVPIAEHLEYIVPTAVWRCGVVEAFNSLMKDHTLLRVYLELNHAKETELPSLADIEFPPPFGKGPPCSVGPTISFEYDRDVDQSTATRIFRVKTAHCHPEIRYFFLGGQETPSFVLHMETQTSGIPMADAFKIIERFRVTYLSEDVCQLDCECSMWWHHQVYFQNKITRESYDRFHKNTSPMCINLTNVLNPNGLKSRISVHDKYSSMVSQQLTSDSAQIAMPAIRLRKDIRIATKANEASYFSYLFSLRKNLFGFVGFVFSDVISFFLHLPVILLQSLVSLGFPNSKKPVKNCFDVVIEYIVELKI
eukprot:GHVP01054791.1.p1 GENE.GHVP01054791.1~~GHVP01054791.1.p1  ORF type:complete len:702 (+),score=115.21 GHVP01054791.1:1487-3592(+)